MNLLRLAPPNCRLRVFWAGAAGSALVPPLFLLLRAIASTTSHLDPHLRASCTRHAALAKAHLQVARGGRLSDEGERRLLAATACIAAALDGGGATSSPPTDAASHSSVGLASALRLAAHLLQSGPGGAAGGSVAPLPAIALVEQLLAHVTLSLQTDKAREDAAVAFDTPRRTSSWDVSTLTAALDDALLVLSAAEEASSLLRQRASALVGAIAQRLSAHLTQDNLPGSAESVGLRRRIDDADRASSAILESRGIVAALARRRDAWWPRVTPSPLQRRDKKRGIGGDEVPAGNDAVLTRAACSKLLLDASRKLFFYSSAVEAADGFLDGHSGRGGDGASARVNSTERRELEDVIRDSVDDIAASLALVLATGGPLGGAPVEDSGSHLRSGVRGAGLFERVSQACVERAVRQCPLATRDVFASSGSDRGDGRDPTIATAMLLSKDEGETGRNLQRPPFDAAAEIFVVAAMDLALRSAAALCSQADRGFDGGQSGTAFASLLQLRALSPALVQAVACAELLAFLPRSDAQGNAGTTVSGLSQTDDERVRGLVLSATSFATSFAMQTLEMGATATMLTAPAAAPPMATAGVVVGGLVAPPSPSRPEKMPPPPSESLPPLSPLSSTLKALPTPTLLFALGLVSRSLRGYDDDLLSLSYEPPASAAAPVWLPLKRRLQAFSALCEELLAASPASAAGPPWRLAEVEEEAFKAAAEEQTRRAGGSARRAPLEAAMRAARSAYQSRSITGIDASKLPWSVKDTHGGGGGGGRALPASPPAPAFASESPPSSVTGSFQLRRASLGPPREKGVTVVSQYTAALVDEVAGGQGALFDSDSGGAEAAPSSTSSSRASASWAVLHFASLFESTAALAVHVPQSGFSSFDAGTILGSALDAAAAQQSSLRAPATMTQAHAPFPALQEGASAEDVATLHAVRGAFRSQRSASAGISKAARKAGRLAADASHALGNALIGAAAAGRTTLAQEVRILAAGAATGTLHRGLYAAMARRLATRRGLSDSSAGGGRAAAPLTPPTQQRLSHLPSARLVATLHALATTLTFDRDAIVVTLKELLARERLRDEAIASRWRDVVAAQQRGRNVSTSSPLRGRPPSPAGRLASFLLSVFDDPSLDLAVAAAGVGDSVWTHTGLEPALMVTRAVGDDDGDAAALDDESVEAAVSSEGGVLWRPSWLPRADAVTGGARFDGSDERRLGLAATAYTLRAFSPFPRLADHVEGLVRDDDGGRGDEEDSGAHVPPPSPPPPPPPPLAPAPAFTAAFFPVAKRANGESPPLLVETALASACARILRIAAVHAYRVCSGAPVNNRESHGADNALAWLDEHVAICELLRTRRGSGASGTERGVDVALYESISSTFALERDPRARAFLSPPADAPRAFDLVAQRYECPVTGAVVPLALPAHRLAIDFLRPAHTLAAPLALRAASGVAATPSAAAVWKSAVLLGEGWRLLWLPLVEIAPLVSAAAGNAGDDQGPLEAGGSLCESTYYRLIARWLAGHWPADLSRPFTAAARSGERAVLL